MSKIEIQILDYTNGVLGTLDITDSQNFPLVLSYLVSDARDIETKFGDFSKSFDVPATKNNNKLFNNIYNAQIDDDKSITDLKDCRILVDTQAFFKGKIQIKGNKQSSRPLSYNCTLFGGNYGWLSKIKDLYLCDLYTDTDTFTYNTTNIQNTWSSNQSVSPIVFPLVDYGILQYPPHGTAFWGSDVGVMNYGKDWRPSFYIYNLLHKIADNVGYTIESNFFEDSDFKKLISHFPPNLGNKALAKQSSHTRQNWNQTSGQSNKAIWDSNVTSRDIQILVASNTKALNSSGVDTGFQRLKFNSVISDDNSVYDSSTGMFTCQESGYYDFENTAHLVIGNFDDDQGTLRRVGSRMNVKLRIRKYDTSSATTSTIFETSDDNSKVGEYNYKNWLGIGQTTNSHSYDNSGAVNIPTINCVKISAKKENVYLATGDKIYVDASVKCASHPSDITTNIRWGVVNLQDKDQKSYAGSFTNLRIQGMGFNGSFYNTNNTDNVVNIWEEDEIPFSRLQRSSVDNPDYAWDETYKFNELLPCNVRQIDFIKGVAHMFNLQFRTDPVLNKIYIEPYNDFYKDKSLAYDWTNKLDLSKEIEDKYQVGLTEEISFEYKNDSSDGLMSYINNQFRDASSQYKFYNYYENLGDNFRKGITKFVNPLFSSTWTDWDGHFMGGRSDNGVLVPAINSQESLYGLFLPDIKGREYPRPQKIFKYNPRIFYYDGYVQNPNNANLQTFWMKKTQAPSSTSAQLFNPLPDYPRATFVDWEDISFSNKFANLSYDDEDIQPPLDSSPPVTKLGLFNTYYKKMIDQLKANPRIRVMHFNLKKSDMINLDLSRLIYIDGTYWRINKIIDYSPVKNITTKVECVQWIEKS